MAGAATRWTLPDLESAVQWCKKRNTGGIRCIVALLGEHAHDRQEAFRWVKGNIECVRALQAGQLDASVTIKLTAIGALFDPEHCRENTLAILREAGKKHVGMEIDMEGKGLVDHTIGTAVACAREGYSLTLALQAYLYRTGKDLHDVVSEGIGIRLVKGAYHGDIEDFREIQKRFRTSLEDILRTGATVSVATHDPMILDWIRDELSDEKSRLELGFLLGLADRTKSDLVREGWTVSEYVPYGADTSAYIARREFYLRQLESMGFMPAP